MAAKVSGRGEKILRETQTPYLATAEREVLARFIAHLEAECGDEIRRVILFGSKARGDAAEDSDTDVLIVVTDESTRERVEAITRKDAFEMADSSWMNWRILTEEDYADQRRLGFPFYVNIRRDGKELWDETAALIEETEYPLEFQEGASREMTPETIETIRMYVHEAHQSWEAVARLRDDMPLFAIPPAYYAAFYVTSAALYAVNVVRGKHKGVRDGLSEFLIKPKLIEAEYQDIYIRLMNSRIAVDYRPFRERTKTQVPTDEEARQLLDDAERFIARMEQFLRERGAID